MAARPTLRGRTAVTAPRGADRPAVRSARVSHGVRRVRPAGLLVSLLAVVLLTASACGGQAGAGDAKTTAAVNVFAAASLTEAFTQLGDAFTAAHPGVGVTLNFAGSNDLVAQIRQGAPADVFASADTVNMDQAGDLVDDPKAFAGNQLAIAVAPGNPESITELSDLSRPGLKVVLAAPEVPAGKYGREILDRAGVSVSPVSLEVSVKGVVTKIALGEADAGLVYVTDVTAAGGDIAGVDIPRPENVIAAYPIATVTGSGNRTLAREFVDFALSREGRAVLADYGFLPPPSE